MTRTLIVDGEASFLIAAERALTQANHEVSLAATAPQAMNLLNRGAAAFDLLITELMLPLPGLNGIELAELARQCCPGLKTVIVSSLTAHARVSDAEVRSALEVDAYLTKPVSEGDLLHTIRRLVEEETGRRQDAKKMESSPAHFETHVGRAPEPQRTHQTTLAS